MKHYKPIFARITHAPLIPGKTFQNRQTGNIEQKPARQKLYLYTGDDLPSSCIEIRVDDATGPLQPGDYLLAGDAIGTRYVGSGDNLTKVEHCLTTANLKLCPVEAAFAFLLPSMAVKEPAKEAGKGADLRAA